MERFSANISLVTLKSNHSMSVFYKILQLLLFQGDFISDKALFFPQND